MILFLKAKEPPSNANFAFVMEPSITSALNVPVEEVKCKLTVEESATFLTAGISALTLFKRVLYVHFFSPFGVAESNPTILSVNSKEDLSEKLSKLIAINLFISEVAIFLKKF
jgi:hypothetical protein